MVKGKKSAKRKQSKKIPKKKEKFMIYKEHLHSVAITFANWIRCWKKRVIFSLITGFILSFFSKTYPICSQERCYKIFAEMIINPTIIFEPLMLNFLLPQFLLLFIFFSGLWYILFTLFNWIGKKKLIFEFLTPIFSLLLFIYMLLVTSGTITPFVIAIGNIDCITNSDCIRAGYVGEICASIYKPVYTKYSHNLKPVENCRCVNYKCIGN